MTLSDDLEWRGLIKDRTFEELTWLNEPKTFYLGTDCSADSLTIGNLAVLLLARRLQKAGWKTILLVGGATSLIGDPGGKSEERTLKSRDEVARNVAAIKIQVSRLFEGEKFELVDNYDWFKDIGYLEFLRDVGKHFSMTELVQRDFIATRLGSGAAGISYAEFSYNLIQGYDYWYLFKHYGVVLQIGGSDQWGNMLSGAPLIRKREGAEVHAMSMPLIIDKTTGKKFGKSEAGAIWLDARRTTPTQFYQFWINIDDAVVEEYLKVYTFLDKTDIDLIMARHVENPQQRFAQVRLAQEITAVVHGQKATKLAEAVTEYLSGKKHISQASAEEHEAIRAEIPVVAGSPGYSMLRALVEGGLASSLTEARRLIAGNAIYVNGERATGENFKREDTGVVLVRKGKAFKDTILVAMSSS